MSDYYVGISISDLQQWLADDSLPVIISRVFHSRVQLDASAPEESFEGLFKRLPSFALDDPAGVLVAQVGPPETWMADDEPDVRVLGLKNAKRFFPLTEDAGRVLAVTWTRVIHLEEAFFEKWFLRFRLRKKRDYADLAGRIFTSAFIDYSEASFAPNPIFRDSLPRALMGAEHHKPDEINKLLNGEFENNFNTWVERAFGYTRHKQIDRPENLKSFYDVGLILSEVGSQKTLTDSLRSICERLKEVGEPSLADICSDPELLVLKFGFYFGKDEGDASIHPVTLALFLRWKQDFHDNRSSVNTEYIFNDVRALSGLVEVEIVSNALWMMGAYLGMENVSPIFRYLNSNRYPGLKFSADQKLFRPVQVWEICRGGSSVQPDSSGCDDFQKECVSNEEADRVCNADSLEGQGQGGNDSGVPKTCTTDGRDGDGELGPKAEDLGGNNVYRSATCDVPQIETGFASPNTEVVDSKAENTDQIEPPVASPSKRRSGARKKSGRNPEEKAEPKKRQRQKNKKTANENDHSQESGSNGSPNYELELSSTPDVKGEA